jgi:energy-coupling factor transporter ATP-binding protein EcfA2
MTENDKEEYRNWYKTLKRIQKKELILFVILILLAFIFVGISSDICKWLKTKVIYDIVKNNCCINIPICIIISGFTIWWWTKIWEDKDIRPYRLGLIISLLIITYYSKVKYADITKNISYEHFFIAILGISAIIIIIRFYLSPYFNRKSLSEWYLDENRFKRLKQRINDIIYKQDNKTELKGFSVDNTEIKLEDNQKEYAKTLVKKLKNTDLSKESFAVGITGEWGSGKSTFLNTMKKEIEKEDFAEIVEFNPWLCNSPEQVTQDFFATLINELSPKHSTLSRDINKYAKLLNKIAKPSLSFFGIDLDLTPGDDSLDELKENISNKLAKLPKKVVILIDDTDRLEGNEVFEILRLIRNTADFKNVIYIATYDKEYVIDVLKENKINDPDNYLEKIFQTEVHLPKVEGSELWKTLMKDLRLQTLNADVINFDIGILIIEHHELIFKILGNYRQVKRFTRQFSAYLDYLYSTKENLIHELSIIDLFWIELLQTYDKKVYNKLAKDRYSILLDGNNGYTINPRTKTDEWNDKTKEILEIIFEKEYNDSDPFFVNDYNNSRRLCLRENYDKYFSLSIAPYKISFDEMRKMLVSNNPENVINEWISQEKSIESIFFHFYQFKFSLSNVLYLNNYIIAILYTALKYEDIWINKVKTLLHINNYLTLEQNAKDIANTWFENKINNLDDTTELQRLSSLLNNLHEGPEEGDYEMIISYKEIEKYLEAIITKVLNRNNYYSALGILQPRFELNVIFKNCCVQFFIENEDDYYEQIALDIVIKHFSKKENKPTLEEFDKVYKENYDYDNMTDDEINKIDTELTKLFGSNYEKNLKTFKEQCFTHN